MVVIKGIALSEKKICIYDKKFNDNETVNIYCDNKYATLSLKKFKEAKRNPITSDYIMIFQKRKYVWDDNKNTGKPLVIYEVTDGKFTKKDIIKKVQELSKEMKKKGIQGEIKTALHYGANYSLPWYGGLWTSYGDKINIFNLVEYEDYELPEPKYFDKYTIFLRNTK